MNMSFFLPTDITLINALTRCANQKCRKVAEPLTLKMCTACRSTWYCNVDCQKIHWKNHKHQCKKEEQNIKDMKDNLLTMKQPQGIEENTDGNDHNDNDNDDDDDELFQPIPPQDDCPICLLPLPIENSMRIYEGCCGNFLCRGCCNEDSRVTFERGLTECCAFCRKPHPSKCNEASENEAVILLLKRVEMNDDAAMFIASHSYKVGDRGLPKDPQKAFDLCLRAAELGNHKACGDAAIYYKDGVDVPKDMAKVRKYLKKAVKKGSITSRHNFGAEELEKGNYHLASRHWLISTAAGYVLSLGAIASFYQMNFVTKKEYSTALASYRNVHKDEWSIVRKAAADRFGDYGYDS